MIFFNFFIILFANKKYLFIFAAIFGIKVEKFHDTIL